MENGKIIDLELEVERKEEELSVLKERLFREKYHFAGEKLIGKCFMRKDRDEVHAMKIVWVDTPFYGSRTILYAETVTINYTALHSCAEYHKNVLGSLEFLFDDQEITEEEYNAIKVEAAEKILKSLQEKHGTTEETPNEATSVTQSEAEN